MSSAQTSADIIREALSLAGEVDSGQSQYHAACVPWLNKLHEDILSGASMFNVDVGQPYPWARSETQKTLILKAPYESGGVTLTNGSASGVFTTTPGVALGSFVDRFLKTANCPDFYKITAHTAGSANFTLETAWVSDSVTGEAFKAIPLIYDLGSGILRLVEPINIYRASGFEEFDGRCYGIHINELKRNYPLARVVGRIPERFAVLFSNETKFKIQFSSYVSENVKVDLDWIPIPELLEDSHTSIPLVPHHKRSVLVYGLAARIAMEKKNWEAFGNFGKMAGTVLASMQIETIKTAHSTAKNRGQLIPRLDQVSKAKYRGF